MSTSVVEPRPSTRLIARWVAVYAGLCVVCGLLSALFWVCVVRLPEYEVRADGRAVIGERGLAAFFATDAWFVLTGLMVGAGLGYLAWCWFRPLGWATSALGGLGALLAAVCCWGFGSFVGPGPLADRLAGAQPGEHIPIAFELSAVSALAAWPFAAMVPLLLLATFARDPEDPDSDSGSAADAVAEPDPVEA